MTKSCLVAAAAAFALSACGGGSGGSGGGGAFTLDVDTVRLTMEQDQQTIPIRHVAVHVTGPDAAYVGAGYVSGQQPPSWLALDLVDMGANTFDLRISLSTNSVAPGAYATTFQVGTADAHGNVLATRDVHVTAGVVALDVSPAAIVLGGADGLAPGAQTLSLTLRTGTAVAHPYALSLQPAAGGWLSATPPSGTVGDAGQAITVDAAPGQAPGTYTGQIGVTVTYEDLQLARTVPVTLNLEEHRLVVGEAGVGFTSSPGRSVLQRDVGVFSSLGRSVAWTATADQGWLTVTPGGLTGQPLHLAADPSGLAAGQTYEAEVTVTSDDPEVTNSQKIRVGLAVRSAAAQDVSVAAVAARMAASPVEPIVYTVAGGADVTAFDVDTGAVARTLAGVAAQADGIAVSPDGRQVYVFDGASGKTLVVDAVSGAPVREFPARASSAYAPLGGILGFRPGGHDVLVTPYGTAFELGTGAEVDDPNSLALGGAYALSATPDGRYVAGSHGFAEVRYTAVGDVRLRAVAGGVGPYAPMTEQGCITADGGTYYRAAADCSDNGSGYAFCGWDVATRQAVPVLTGKAYPAAIACPWNGLVIGGTSSFYDAQDLYYYGPSGASLGMGNSSQRTTNRDLLADGIAVSADGVRLVTLTRGSMGYDPSDEIRFQTLPAP